MGTAIDIISILGHTAGGKTRLAAMLAAALNTEIISADSRQVYRGMNIGTGKDYGDYIIDGKQIPVHLIDIVDAGAEYNVFEFQRDFVSAYQDLKHHGKIPILCGGTGMYIESILRNYRLDAVPANPELRKELEKKSLTELIKLLQSLRSTHNTTDLTNRKRAIRAIEIAMSNAADKNGQLAIPELSSLTFGIRYEREERRKRITERLRQRLENGMVEEVQEILEQGVTHEKLEYYGLEYKFLSYYISGKLSYSEMFSQLNTAIHRFAKRQMTYFRGMERRGIPIHWLDGHLKDADKLKRILDQYQSI